MANNPYGPRRIILRRDYFQEQLTWFLTIGMVALAALAFIVPSTSSIIGAPTASENSGASLTEVAVDEISSATPQSFTISVSGDVLIHERVAQAALTNDSYDFTPLFSPVKDIISGADLAICHLEVPISSNNQDLSFANGAFRAPMEIADGLKDAGFDSCSVASNHAYDSGESSVTSTVSQLARVGIPGVGMATSVADAARLWQFEVEGTQVGHLSYTYGLNGRDLSSVPDEHVAIIDEAKILADAARHREAGSEFIIVSMHWGDEFVTGLNAQQQDLGPRLIASPNIDLIVGHHAHVPQQIVEINGEYIIYGLGNLLSNQSAIAPECPSACPLESQDGALVDINIEQVDGRPVATSVVAHPTWVDVGGTWKIISALNPPDDVAIEAEVLNASTQRTLITLGVDAAS